MLALSKILTTEFMIHGAFWVGFIAGFFLWLGISEMRRATDSLNRVLGGICAVCAVALMWYFSPGLFHRLIGEFGFSYRVGWLHVFSGAGMGTAAFLFVTEIKRLFIKVCGFSLLLMVPIFIEEQIILFWLGY